MVTNSDVLKQYDICFDENGNIKSSGRNACIRLIELMEARFPHEGSFGNKETGFMDAVKIKQFAAQCREVEHMRLY